jgi:hypothetical protein
MKISIVVASTNRLTNLETIKADLTAHSSNVVVVDEGDEVIRAQNARILDGLPYTFNGPKERLAWFKERFADHEKYASVIPERCHAETSFGFLAALEQGADAIIEIDDDVYPCANGSFVRQHLENLSGTSQSSIVMSKCRWYNTLESLQIDATPRIWPRGHPYSTKFRCSEFVRTNGGGPAVLNVGLWAGDPDLDALTLVQLGGLDGKGPVQSRCLRHNRTVVGTGTYFAVCSMNTAFKAEIVPSFYQLYMKAYGIDRFDDIWSGIFLKKIADHLGDGVSLGGPLGLHNKRPRDVFRDLQAELEGMVINETLWQVVDSLDINGKDYRSCYESLTGELGSRLSVFPDKTHRDFLNLQVDKMRLWLEVVDRVG